MDLLCRIYIPLFQITVCVFFWERDIVLPHLLFFPRNGKSLQLYVCRQIAELCNFLCHVIFLVCYFSICFSPLTNLGIRVNSQHLYHQVVKCSNTNKKSNTPTRCHILQPYPDPYSNMIASYSSFRPYPDPYFELNVLHLNFGIHISVFWYGLLRL